MKHPGKDKKGRIIPSASIIFWKSNDSKSNYPNNIDIFLAKRKSNLKAFPNLYAGVGGKVSSSDREFVQKHISDPKNQNSFIFKLCAIREAFEETSILLSKTAFPATSQENHETTLNLPFEDLEWDKLVPAGIKITPEFSMNQVRFDTQFYFVELSSEQRPEIGPQHPEFSEGFWYSPKIWMQKFEQQIIQIAAPVLSVLHHLLESSSINAAAQSLERLNNLPIGLQTKIEIHPGMQGIPLKSPTLKPAITTNLVIVGRDPYYLIDPGTHYPEELQLLDKILQHGISSIDGIKGILLTHYHEDHWRSVPYLQEHYNIPVLCHEETKKRIGNEIQIEKTLKDGDILKLGFDDKSHKDWNLEVIYTGGHSVDHITFLDSRFNALIAGDFVSGIGTVLVEDMGQYFTGLRRLLQLNSIGIILPAHGPMHYDGQKLLQQYLDHRLERQQLILEAWIQVKKSSLSINEIVKYAYQDVPESYHSLAARQVETYLRYFLEENLVQKENNLYKKVEP